MTPSRAVLLAIAGIVVLSPDAALIRLADTDVLTIMQWRGLLAGCAILVWLALRHGVTESATMLREAGMAGYAYALLYGLTGILFVYAASTTTVANTLFILATVPVFAALFSRLLLGEVISRATFLTMIGVGIGLCLIALEEGSASGHAPDIRGDAAALLAAMSLGLAFTLLRRAGGVSLLPMVGLAGFLQAAIAFAIMGVVVPQAHSIWPIAVMGLICVPVAFALITTAARHLPATDTSLIMLLEAVFGPLIVWAIFGEVPGALALCGGLIVISTLAMNALSRR